MTAVVIAGIVGGPVSGALLSLDGAGGLAGWQWLFVVEGLPAVVLGFVVLRTLPEQPSDARWLTPAEQRGADDAAGGGGDRGRDNVHSDSRRADERAHVAAGGRVLHDSGRALRDVDSGCRRSSRARRAPATSWSACSARSRTPSRPSAWSSSAATRTRPANGAGTSRCRRSWAARRSRWRDSSTASCRRIVAAVARDARARVDARSVLGVRDVVSRRHRRGGGHRARQLGRQHRRFRRSEHHRLRSADDQQLLRPAWRSSARYLVGGGLLVLCVAPER